MAERQKRSIAGLIGEIPYRMAFAGGWIDQPFVSSLNPEPPGSMVVVAVKPQFRFMDRCGMATSTREVANRIWQGRIPDGDPAELMRELYETENCGRVEPSGSQDMAGLIYPGINRLDYDASYQGGYYPAHVESSQDPDIARWLEGVVHILPVNQRPAGYSPLGTKNLSQEWIRRLGQCGKDCYRAILAKNLADFGETMNESMRCWEAILPHTVAHDTIPIDLKEILTYYQRTYAGAMYSGCGGGYLYVVADEPVPGSLQIRVRLAGDEQEYESSFNQRQF